jgi:dipeptidyl aminopeptidase/acylaminoacyl peptidase
MNRALFVACAFLSTSTAANALPPIEAYGELPSIRSVAISPDGKYFAYLTRQNGEDYFAVSEAGGKLVGGARTGDVKARSVWFPAANHVVLVASETTGAYGFRGKWEHSGAISYNIASKKMVALMRGTKALFPAQTGLGRIVGRLRGANKVFMPAFVGEATSDPDYSLLRVDLDTGSGVVVSKGAPETSDWIVDEAGTVLVREDWDDKDDYYKILTKKEGGLDIVYRETKIDRPTFGVLGVTADGSSVIVSSKPRGSQFYQLYKMSYEGELSLPIFSPPNKEAEQVLSSGNRAVLGVRFAGMSPSYDFFDKSLSQAMDDVAALNPESSTILTDWTADFSKLLLYIDGGEKAPAYWIFDRTSRAMSRIARSYTAIDDKDVGPTATIEYKARDGRKIPSVITRPPGTELGAAPLPLIVMPHGGPESYDAVGFDWMAQYFASRGYLVLQPNYRGSDGFGADHRKAGHGEWGGKMQDDITDGVNLLVKYKWADASRVCIIGGSYGGYAALAGGAYTPDLYKCVAAIAPVSDLSMMLAQEKRESGSDSYVYEYWTDLIGDRKTDKAKIEAISPVNAAESFKAPVLLIHGVDDTVVPYAHSSKMEEALKKAGKSVRLVKLKGEDHWLSVSETRLQTLIELDKLVSETIGAQSPAPQ